MREGIAGVYDERKVCDIYNEGMQVTEGTLCYNEGGHCGCVCCK